MLGQGQLSPGIRLGIALFHALLADPLRGPHDPLLGNVQLRFFYFAREAGCRLRHRNLDRANQSTTQSNAPPQTHGSQQRHGAADGQFGRLLAKLISSTGAGTGW